RHRRHLVRHGDGPRRGLPLLLAPRERVEQRREVGPRVGEQVLHAARGEQLQVGVGRALYLDALAHRAPPRPPAGTKVPSIPITRAGEPSIPLRLSGSAIIVKRGPSWSRRVSIWIIGTLALSHILWLAPRSAGVTGTRQNAFSGKQSMATAVTPWRSVHSP